MQVRQGRVVLPDEDEVVRQYHVLNKAFVAAGFHQYEVSNYAVQASSRAITVVTGTAPLISASVRRPTALTAIAAVGM